MVKKQSNKYEETDYINYDEIDDINYDKNNKEESDIIKTVRILLNKNIYSHSYTNQ